MTKLHFTRSNFWHGSGALSGVAPIMRGTAARVFAGLRVGRARVTADDRAALARSEGPGFQNRGFPRSVASTMGATPALSGAPSRGGVASPGPIGKTARNPYISGLNRRDLTDAHWARSSRSGKAERPPHDHRRMLNGILRVLHTSAPWHHLPRRYGPWASVASHLYRWQRRGILTRARRAGGEGRRRPAARRPRAAPGCTSGRRVRYGTRRRAQQPLRRDRSRLTGNQSIDLNRLGERVARFVRISTR